MVLLMRISGCGVVADCCWGLVAKGDSPKREESKDTYEAVYGLFFDASVAL
jgi:hypothetical protein